MLIYCGEQIANNLNDCQALNLPVVIAGSSEKDIIFPAFRIDVTPDLPEENSKTAHLESHSRYEYIAIHIPNFADPKAEPNLIETFISSEYLIMLGDNPVLDQVSKGLSSDEWDERNFARTLSLLFSAIISMNAELLEGIEDEIQLLEELATGNKPEDHKVTIIGLRKQILSLNRYFEALYKLLEDIDENRKNIFNRQQLEIFRLHKNRVGRQLSMVLSLRDYLTQVREAYQNQMDLSLNETMQFFTIITAIFLPLTLIVGWYGMNLHMPEATHRFAYPAVILVSLVFVFISLLYCKRKGWF